MIFPDDDLIQVYPFERHVESDDVIIANRARSSLVAVPAEAVELLDWLAAGRTVSEARAEYQRAYGVAPDFDDFLNTLAEEDFIVANTSDANGILNEPASAVPERSGYHFQSIPVGVARKFVST